MLVVFYGTSCVGKTTLMKYLCDNYDWKMISVYMTRPVREGECQKKQVSMSALITGEARGDFLPLNQCYGNYYGTPTMELKFAENDKEHIWCLDFPIERRQLFSDYKYCGIIVLPQNQEQLIQQAQKSNRMNRLEQILIEYERYYRDVSNYELFHVINYQNDIERTCNDVYKIISNYEE